MSFWWARPLLRTAQGATITFGSTIISCALALQVEQSANRLFFYLMPHKYATVDRAYGLTQEQLDSVRHLRVTTETTAVDTTKQQDETTLTVSPPREVTFLQEMREVASIGFSGETLFSLEQQQPSKPSMESLPLPQLWKQDMIACSMTG
jgi:hypothetical protein